MKPNSAVQNLTSESCAKVVHKMNKPRGALAGL